MAERFLIRNRYEVQSVLGRGGMGVVYKAFDTLMRRDVALKTLHDVDSVFVDLFYRECSVLAAMVHPNVIEIFDMGEFEENGLTKPYFVMPLLPGRTLYDLVYPESIPLAMSRCVDIICQACRGLQAAHDRGLLHRDIKPRNIFVIHDDAVKIIDFGVAHLLGNNSTGVRGTPQYMSPEQITFRPLTNRSDIFSLGAVAYEALTAVHPFLRDPGRRDSDSDIASAITSHNPALASELNPSVSRAVAQVVAKAMAKDPWARFESATAFADAMQKAMRNETIEQLDSSAMRIRLERARRSFDQRDYQFAFEIIRELEAEGHSDPGIPELHQLLDKAVQTERTDRLVEAAKRCFDQEELTLALRKVQEILEIDPANIPALALKKKIEAVLTEQKVAELLKTASQHLERAAFTGARQALQDALKLRPNDPRARQLLNDVDSGQKDLLRQRQEQERLYQLAQAAWLEGKIDSAIENLAQLATLTGHSSQARERVTEYKEFHRRVQSEHDALQSAIAQVRDRIEKGELAGAQAICTRYLAKYPNYPALEELTAAIAEKRQQEAAAFRQKIEDRLRDESDLAAQIHILEDALKLVPNDDHFEKELQRVREKQKEVNAAVKQARSLEQRGNFEKALQQWQSLERIYPGYPGLGNEIARVTSSLRREREQAKAKHIGSIKKALDQEDFSLADRLLRDAEAEFTDDSEIRDLRSQREKQVEQFKTVSALIEEAKQGIEQGRFQDALTSFRNAAELASGLRKVRVSVFTALVESAEKITARDWRAAEKLLQQAAQLDSSLAVPAKIWAPVRQQQREESIVQVLEEVARKQEAGNLQEAREGLSQALDQYPKEARLQARLASIDAALTEKRRSEERDLCLNQLNALNEELKRTEHPANLQDFLTTSQTIAGRYGTDPEIVPILIEIGEQVSLYQQATGALSGNGVPECLQICEQILKRDPSHRLFLGLKAHAAVREREQAAEYLERVEKRLAAEPDLTVRAQILEDALQKYPDEPYFKEELNLVRNELNLVNSIVQRAQKFEDSGELAEALDQWKNVQAIYPFHPNLENSIQRCSKALLQKQQQARSNWISQVESALAEYDYPAASDRLKQGQREFPDDQKLSALGTVLSERIERRSRAERLLVDAGTHSENGRFPEAQASFREAVEFGQNDPVIAKSIAESLIRYSREALRVNSKLAESMISQARSLQPHVQIPNDLQINIGEAREREELNGCLDSIRTLEAAGDLQAALQVARDFLATYPGHAQLQATENRLLKAQEETRKREERNRSIEQLKAVEDQAKTVANTENLLDLLKRTQQISKRNPQDQEITRIAGELGEVLSALTETRKLLGEDRLAEAEELCARYSKQFPRHPRFAELRSEIETRRRELAAEYLRHVERWLAAERDWAKQEQILEEAVRLYPDEIYYSDELSLVRNNQALLAAQIARARELEPYQLSDALQEWEALRTMYPWLPGINQEVERVSRAWQQKQSELRDDWVRRIKVALADSDYQSAAQLIGQAGIDFPQDRRLSELQHELDESSRNHSIAEGLFAKGQDFLARGQFAEGSEYLHKAFQLLPQDRNFHASLIDVLLRYAHAALKENWQASEALVSRIIQIQPSYPVPADLLDSLQRSRREAEINNLLAQLAEAESKRDWTAANRLIQLGRSKYSAEQRIQEKIESTEALLQQVEAERLHAEALRELNAIRSQLDSTSKKKQLLSLRDKFQSRKFANFENPEIQAIAADLLQKINTKLDLIAAPPPKKKAAPQPRTEPIPSKPESRERQQRPWLFIAAAAALLITAAAFWASRSHAPKPNITSPPPPVASPAPASPSIQIGSNLDTGEIYLDGTKVGPLNGSLLALKPPPEGAHIIKITSGEGEASWSLNVAPGATPSLSGPITATKLQVVAVSNDGKSGAISTSTLAPEPVFLDSRAAGTTKDGSLVLSDLTPGTHHVQVGEGDNPLKFDLPVSEKPSLYAFVAPPSQPANVSIAKSTDTTPKLNSPPKLATLEIRGAAPGTQVRIDGSLLGMVPKNRTLRQPLAPGNHSIELSRDGFISKRLQHRFDPGQNTLLVGTDIELEPVVPAAATLEAEDWNRVSATRNPADLQEFLRKYPSGAHAEAAHQKMQQIEWNTLDKKNSNSLQAFITKYPQGPFTSQARDLLKGLTDLDKARAEQRDWDSVDQNSRTSIQGFLDKHPGGAHSAAAQQALADLIKKANAAELARQAPTSHPPPASSPSDSAAVLAVIQRFADAWSEKNLDQVIAIQPTLNPRVVKNLLSGVRSIRVNITPASAPQIKGDSATVACRRRVEQTFEDGTKKQSPESVITYTFARRAGTWVIESAQ